LRHGPPDTTNQRLEDSDLPGRARENAEQLYTSLHTKLLTLPNEVEIYPGHFSGSVCGTGLSGKPTSTLAFEKHWNRMLSLDRQAFVDGLTNVPPKPADMEEIVAFNRGVRLTAHAEQPTVKE
jgi:hypothetical protein